MSKRFVVIGLGQLGNVVAGSLVSMGHEVLGIDADKNLIQALSDDLPDVELVSADATDEDVLREFGVGQFDGAVVAIGGDGQAATIVTLALKEMGVPMVVARATEPLHARLLRRIGADHVIEPEREVGKQVAQTLVSSSVVDYFELGEGEALVETEVPEQWAGKRLSDLDLGEHGLAIVIVKPEGEGGRIPTGETMLNEGDMVVVGGSKDKLDEMDLFDG